MTTPLSTTPGADLPSPFGWGRGSLNDSFWYTGWLLTFLAAGDQTQGRFALIDALARKGNCPPRHIHRNEDESFYILEGKITAWIGDQTIRGTAGTLIFSPRGVPHSFEIHSDQVRMPILLTPAGLEGYFKQFCTPAPALILPPPAEVQYADVTNPNSVVAFISNAHDSTQAKNGLEWSTHRFVSKHPGKLATAMNTTDLNHEWIRLSPAWIKQARTHTMPSRDGLLDKPMLAACGDVRGLSILDSGCGEGRFCRILLDRGSERVLGVDLCEPMINAARELQSGKDTYRVADAEDLSFLDDHSFDLAVSYLNQCDLCDFKANTREVFRVLKPGGRFVIANVHPMRSAVGEWHTTCEGAKQHVILDHYFDESERHWRMLDCDFTNFHRTLATYVNGFRKSGFLIDDIIEPSVDAEGLARFPELADELRVPNFIIFVLEKP